LFLTVNCVGHLKPLWLTGMSQLASRNSISCSLTIDCKRLKHIHWTASSSAVDYVTRGAWRLNLLQCTCVVCGQKQGEHGLIRRPESLSAAAEAVVWSAIGRTVCPACIRSGNVCLFCQIAAASACFMSDPVPARRCRGWLMERQVVSCCCSNSPCRRRVLSVVVWDSFNELFVIYSSFSSAVLGVDVDDRLFSCGDVFFCPQIIVNVSLALIIARWLHYRNALTYLITYLSHPLVMKIFSCWVLTCHWPSRCRTSILAYLTTRSWTFCYCTV